MHNLPRSDVALRKGNNVLVLLFDKAPCRICVSNMVHRFGPRDSGIVERRTRQTLLCLLANRREIYPEAMLHQTGVTSWSSGFRGFMKILTRQNCIGAKWSVAIPAEAGLMYVNATLVQSWEAREGAAANTEAFALHGSSREESDHDSSSDDTHTLEQCDPGLNGLPPAEFSASG